MKTKSNLKSKILDILFYTLVIAGIAFIFRAYISENILKRTEGISNVFKLAGNNKSELKKVLEHYRFTKEEQKFKAAEYLIENMPGHFGVKQELQDSFGNRVEFDFSQFESHEFMRLSITLDSLGYRFVKTEENYDVTITTSDYLIENIDLAFEVWEYPWCKHLSFEQFCEYILPYRNLSEPLSNYRKYYKEKYSWLIDSMQNVESTVEAATIMQRHIKNNVKFSSSYSTFYGGFLSPRMMEQVGVGSCDNMANYCMSVLRSCGIPITYDRILYWPLADNGHVMNNIIANDGKEYEFALSDNPPKVREIKNLATKVWRNTWKLQTEGLWQYLTFDQAPSNFLSRHTKDITETYCEVSDLLVKTKSWIPEEIIYLCVFNRGDWRPIAWSKRENQNAFPFKKISKNLLYATMTFSNNKLNMTDHPFIFMPKNASIELNPLNIRKLKPDYEKPINFEINFPASEILPSAITGSDQFFELNVWNNKWERKLVKGYLFKDKKIRKKDGTSYTIDTYRFDIKDVPSNALYKFKDMRRPFAYINDELIKL